MSSIKLSPNASGTGIFSIEAPNSSTNRTLTLPDQTGTVLTNAGPFTANASASAGAVTIDASNRVGVGTGSPSQRFVVANAGTDNIIMAENTTDAVKVFLQADTAYGKCYTLTNHALYFGTNNTERARITSGGYSKFSNDGTYIGASSSYHEFRNTANASTLILSATSASLADDLFAIYASRNTTNNTFYAINYYNSGAGAYRFRVADSGNVTNTNNSYGAISDVKLKENVVDATPKLEKLNQVRVVNYNFIGDTQKQLGVIAQELEPIFPGMVEETVDRDEEGNDLGTTTKSVKYSVFVPMLIKAVQELKAEVDALKAQLGAQA